jgi:hypothetical protein
MADDPSKGESNPTGIQKATGQSAMEDVTPLAFCTSCNAVINRTAHEPAILLCPKHAATDDLLVAALEAARALMNCGECDRRCPCMRCENAESLIKAAIQKARGQS